MSHTPAKSPFFPVLLPIFLLAACSMPTEPDGAGRESMTTIGLKLQAQHDDAGAVDFYQRALQRKPDDVVALRNLATILEAHGNLKAAETYDAQGMKVAPDDKDFAYAEGRVLIRLGHADEAHDLYQNLLRDNRHDVRAQNGLGVALDYLGHHEVAQQYYRAALDEEPDNLVTINNLGHSYVLAGDYDEAIQLLETHANDKNATPALRQNLAEAYGMSGMFTDAERMARIDLNPQDVKRNLAYYHSRRAKLTPEPKFAADLGGYPTREMAQGVADKARAIADDSGLTYDVKSDVQAIGGTPSFALRTTGFANAHALDNFCAAMAQNDIGCKAVRNR